jgi:CRP-like cAMP-binding protein
MTTSSDDLAGFALLAELPAADLGRLAESAVRRLVRDGEPLFVAGEPAASMWAIVRGRIVLRAAVGRRSTIVMNAGPGELLGWSALRDGATWLTTGRSVGDSEVIELPAERVLELVGSGSPAGVAFARRLFGLAAEHLAETQAQLLGPGNEGPITGG